MKYVYVATKGGEVFYFLSDSLDPATHQLWLRNPQTLYGVESSIFAPGVKEGA